MEKVAPKKVLKREFSAGGVVFKKVGEKVFWLVTQSNPSDRVPKPHWRLPKGWIDNQTKHLPGPIASGIRKGSEEEIQNAALREVREEAGIEAKIIDKLGTTSFFFSLQGEKILKFVTFYLMEWSRDLPEGPDEETQAVDWLPEKEAVATLDYSSEKGMLRKAAKKLELGTQPGLV